MQDVTPYPTETYGDIVACTHQWRNGWRKIIDSMDKSDQPLWRELIGWNVLKKASLKGILVAGIDTIRGHWDDIELRKGITVLNDFKHEFMQSRKLSKRIHDLFGEIKE